MGADFERALKNFEAFKQKEQVELSNKIHNSLNEKIDAWLASAKNNKEKMLGARIHQSWEKLALQFPISPAHYEYTLKGYKYSTIKSDISRSDSITAPYKAIVIIQEEIYAEKNHSPDISDVMPYFFTVTTNYNLNFEYKQDNLVLVNTDSKITNIENKVPAELLKPKLF